MEKIHAVVFGIQEGYREFHDVDLIRIKSRKYTLLIMRDYMPVVGEIDGSVEIVSGEDSSLFENIRGFYTHKRNNFELLIKED